MARNPNLAEWSAWLKAQASGEIGAAIRAELAKAAARAQRFAKTNATTRPRARSGRLRASINSGVRARPDGSVEAYVGANTSYARIQERGGTVYARGGFLAIPLGAVKTRAGVVRSGPRGYPDAFFIRSRSGNLLLVQRNGKGITPLFLMKRSVKVPPTYFLRNAMITASTTVPDALRKALAASASSASVPTGGRP